MDRKIAKTVTKTLATAALGGMLVGTVGFVAGGCAKTEAGSTAPVAGEKHACKGQNSCKGTSSCKTDQHACKGQNSCKGTSGCKTL